MRLKTSTAISVLVEILVVGSIAPMAAGKAAEKEALMKAFTGSAGPEEGPVCGVVPRPGTDR